MTWNKQLPQRPVVAIAGATGAVGREMLKVLEQRNFPLSQLKLLASSRSKGMKLPFKGQYIEVEELSPQSFQGVDIALFSAGSSVSQELRHELSRAACIMIDNSSAFRMESDVPLVVPEVNPHALKNHQGVIANPNCSTIQMVVSLAPLRKLAPIKRVVVSTYQAASGAGAAAMDELYAQTQDFLGGKELCPQAFAHRIAFNCIPQIDVFMEDGSTKEEWKMLVESKKILEDEHIQIAANCVRVPVLRSHSEAINVEFSAEVSLDDVREVLSHAPGLVLMDNPEDKCYPMPALLAGTDEVFVGRLRRDPSVEHGVAFWNVADQIRKGAALNAVQIAEVLLINER